MAEVEDSTGSKKETDVQPEGTSGKGKKGQARKKSSSRSKGGKKKAQARKEKPTEKAVESEKKTNAPAVKGKFVCEYCQKVMKDSRTLKLHQRYCKAKQEDKKSEVEAELLRLKDEFEDERARLMEQFREKEEGLQREIDELRTVLRMEIERHREEMDRISTVETEVKEARKAKEPEPKAIDMIPVPLPEMPVRSQHSGRSRSEKAQPEAMAQGIDAELDDIPDIMPIGDEPEEMGQDMGDAGIKTPEPEIKSPATPEAQPEPTLPDEDRLRELVMDIVKNKITSIPAPGTPGETVSPARLNDLELEMRGLGNRLSSLEDTMRRNHEAIRRELEKSIANINVKRLERELEKVSERVQEMMEDIGFGEELSVSKIPPTILEIVYQATLDDVLLEIMRTKGAQDAERIAQEALEEVRLKTSGSELFKFDGRKIVTDNLARSIEAGLISAKQIQTTYNVLLERLLETVPHHKAKNFRGMIKVKSQEFAVDRATTLTKEVEALRGTVEKGSQMLAAISAQSSSGHAELRAALEELREGLEGGKADREEVERLAGRLQQHDDMLARLEESLALMRADLDMKLEVMEKAREPETPIAPGEVTAAPVVEETAAPEETEEDRVLAAMQEGATSKTAIMGKTGMPEKAVLAALVRLKDEGKVAEERKGKRVRYLLPSDMLEKKLGAAEPKKEPTGRAGKKKAEIKDEAPQGAAPREAAPEEPKPDKEKKRKPAKGKKPGVKKSGKNAAEEEKTAEPVPEKKPVGEPARKKPAEPKPKKPKKRKEPAKEEKEPEAEETGKKPEEPAAPDAAGPAAQDDIIPAVSKDLDELSEDERRVLDVITPEGMTISGIQSKVGKGMKRFALLRALRVLIDSGYVGIITKGRMDLYQKLDVKKMDNTEQKDNKQEVK